MIITEIGQWMWPAVKVGFEHVAEEVHGALPAILRTISLRPVVFEVRDFLSLKETNEILRIGQKQGLHASQGVMQSGDVERGTKHDSFRTSRQAWLGNGLSPLVKELDDRIANLTRVAASHNEAVQLLRYDEGQYYHGHMDWSELELYPDQKHMWVGSHYGHQDRMATAFWYLNDVAQGGETFFPKHGQPICAPDARGGAHTRYCKDSPDPDMRSCDNGLKVPPRRGAVILWYNFHPSGRGDRNSLHAGCPVGQNLTKWSANKWVRIKPSYARSVEWMPNHPAIKRHGWSGDNPSARIQGCQITFTNRLAHDVDLMWLSDSSWEKLSIVRAGQSLSQSSYPGHKFILQAEEQKSSMVACSPPAGDFVLGPDFKLSEVKGEEL